MKVRLCRSMALMDGSSEELPTKDFPSLECGVPTACSHGVPHKLGKGCSGHDISLCCRCVVVSMEVEEQP